MTSNDEVTIKMDNLGIDNPSASTGEIEADGHSNRHRNHNNEYASSDRRRNRRRSRSRSPSPSRQRKPGDNSHVSEVYHFRLKFSLFKC